MRYLVKKLFAFCLFKISFLKVYCGNIYFRKKNQINKNSKILFLLNDKDFIHLGDSLFYEPIISFFKSNNFKVEVKCNNYIKFFFEDNYQVLNNNFNNYKDYDLIITSTDFIIKTFFENNVIYINNNHYKCKKRIINHNIDTLKKMFKIDSEYTDKPYYPKSKSKSILKKFNYSKDKKYIVFSNYIDSGFFRLSKNKLDTLVFYLYKFIEKNNHYSVIHLGTKNDKLKDKNRYKDFIDLRGLTTVSDLFDLCSLQNIEYYIGFDNFIMHLFFLKNKKLKIMSRGKLTEEGNVFLKKCIDPPYETCTFDKEYI